MTSHKGWDSTWISAEGLQHILQISKNNKYPGQNILWTDDYRVELPIKIGKSGIQSIPPTTIIQQWADTLAKYGDLGALSVKRNNKWVTLTYRQYYQQILTFAKALLSLGLPQFTSVNLIGFNAPQWSIAYIGSIFARCLPVGIYTTNSQQACTYIAQHSEAKVIIAENKEVARKYYKLVEEGKIIKIVLYADEPQNNNIKDKVMNWKSFMQLAKPVKVQVLQERIKKIRPGNCCTLIYTSGTTGMPKGVMLSHDNFIWSCKSSLESETEDIARGPLRIISYLPLSHAAGQFVDIHRAYITGCHIYFADPSALTGSLIQTLQQVKPQAFFSVPRVWEKIYDKMMEISKSNTGILAKIGTWAKSIGEEGTIKEARGQPTSFQFKLAKKLIYTKVKQALGLEECKFFVFGSAPLDPAIRKYYFSLNIYLRNGYGMTECTAPQSTTLANKLILDKKEDYNEVGCQIPGTETRIFKFKEEDEDGQICMRGRNICMGYFKNAEDTSKTIDINGYLHSGDLGRLTKEGVLFITGRVKQLIITAGGENIPPILIENQIKKALPCLSNVMVVGDHRKYLTCLISLKEDPPMSGNLEKSAIDFLESRGCKIKTVKEAINNEAFKKIIMEGLKKANEQAISRAQYVQQFSLMSEDFTIENGMLTPTLKLKRKEALKKYAAEIESMYTKSSL